MLEERAREFLKKEDGVLGDVYQIMAAFAEMLVAEEREACAKTAEFFRHDMSDTNPEGRDKANWIAAAIRARTRVLAPGGAGRRGA